MSDHHHDIDDHHHHDGTPGEGQGSHGLIPPPPDDELAEVERGARGVYQTTTGMLHHWDYGPLPAIKVERPYSVRMRNDRYQRVEWRMPWYLDKVKGTTTAKAVRRLYDVFLDPRGWVRAGVHWVRVYDRSQARIVVRVIPAAETVCGPGAAGCFSWGYEADGKPVAENGVEYIDRDTLWQAITGMECQGHGTFKAHDLYIDHPEFDVVPTVMGTWKSMAAAGYRPTEADLHSARLYLAGKTDPSKIHRH